MDLLKRGSGSRLPKGTWACLAWAGAGVALALLVASCNREFDNPFLPESEGYAGSAWSKDRDGNGIADSVEKYAPGCGSGPVECLRKAQANAGVGTGLSLDSLAVEPLNLVEGGPAQAPRLQWFPPGISGVAYDLAGDNPAVAEPRDSLVAPLAEGTATFIVTARGQGGSAKSATFRVNVTRTRVRVTSISAADLTLSPGLSRAPEIVILPEDATDRRYELLTHDPRVAVIRDGWVEGVAPGQTLVTARSLDGRREALFRVTVIRKLISIGAQPIHLQAGGEAMAPMLEFTPSDASDRSYSLSGGHPGIATVTADGLRVEPVGAGTVWFTASAAGGLTASFTATVDPAVVAVRSVRVADMAITLLAASDSRLQAPVVAWTPADATDRGYTLVSKDPDIARVVSGSVQALRGGEAEVTLTTRDGGKRDTFKVKVTVLIGCGGLLDPCDDGKGKKDGD